MSTLRTLTRRPAAPAIVWLLLCGLTFLAVTTESTAIKVAAVAIMAPVVLGLVLLAFWRIVAVAAHVGAKIGTDQPGEAGGANAPSPECDQ